MLLATSLKCGLLTLYLLLLSLHDEINFLLKSPQILILYGCTHEDNLASLHALASLTSLNSVIPVSKLLLALEFLLDLFKPCYLIQIHYVYNLLNFITLYQKEGVLGFWGI